MCLFRQVSTEALHQPGRGLWDKPRKRRGEEEAKRNGSQGGSGTYLLHFLAGIGGEWHSLLLLFGVKMQFWYVLVIRSEFICCVLKYRVCKKSMSHIQFALA